MKRGTVNIKCQIPTVRTQHNVPYEASNLDCSIRIWAGNHKATVNLMNLFEWLIFQANLHFLEHGSTSHSLSHPFFPLVPLFLSVMSSWFPILSGGLWVGWQHLPAMGASILRCNCPYYNCKANIPSVNSVYLTFRWMTSSGWSQNSNSQSMVRSCTNDYSFHLSSWYF